MFRAGLYVGLGAFGMDMAQSVSNFDGRDGTVPFSGMPRGPSGLEKLLPQVPLSTPGVGIERGAPFEEDIELLEFGRVDSDWPKPRSFANRSDRASADEEDPEPFKTVPTDDTARECMLSGLGETEGFTFCVGGAKTLSEAFLVWGAARC